MAKHRYGIASDSGDRVWTNTTETPNSAFVGWWTAHHERITWMSYNAARAMKRQFKARGVNVEIVKETTNAD